MYKLYYSPGTAALAVHWMLIEMNAPFELVLIDIEKGAQKSADYLKLNPDGRVPTLVVDGAPHFECPALLMLLAERHPEAGFAPAIGAPERADYLQWMFYCANTLQPAFRNWFYPDEAAGAENATATKARARAILEDGFARLDARFGGGRQFMLGSQLTVLDFLVTMLTRWSRNMPKPATAWPHLGAYIDRMRAMPSLREVHKREGLTDWIGG
ncbi:MAG: glutathione S-transferase family protein [Alphaproteobacteria bacterium]|nr:glutathione S-transferase family protein [Alphaproteobacteria bacterium]MDE2164003.1 glutathione S-transferase family protein [Alphaproteobacteria bacterium]MDE2499850.1 glutathione S-transferase family protein [Alphaproteobacteria bacterium]